MGVTEEYCNTQQHKDEKMKSFGMSVEQSDDADRCWEEMYRGDSRKWLISDRSMQLKDMKPVASTMKESYIYPKKELLQMKGRRQLLLEDKLLQEVLQEMNEETGEKEVKLNYLTTYDDLHRTPNFQLTDKKDFDKNKELYEKYPLYGSPSMSYWQFECYKRSSSLRHIPGMTMTKDMKNPFKRNSLFTTPVSQALYCDEQL